MYKAYKVRIYPTPSQASIIDRTIGCCRFIYNISLAERIEFYSNNKDDKEKLKNHKYKTEKEYKVEFPWLKEVSSRALQQSRIDLKSAYSNFFRRIKKGQTPGFPKFKKKGKSTDSYREPQVGNFIRVELNNTRLVLLKLGRLKIRGLPKSFYGEIKNVTVSKSKSNKYFASILVKKDDEKRKRVSDNIIGIDLGLKEFAVCSNGDVIHGIKEKLSTIERKIKIQQRHLSRKHKGSKRWNDCRIKLNILYDYRQNYLSHFQWNLVNKLCSENQAIAIEDLNVLGMRKNRKLSHAIQNVNWISFASKLEQKSLVYETWIYHIDRFFPSSKLCSSCGQIKKDLKLSDRIYTCDCGFEMDRDLNASINIRNEFLTSTEYADYRHGEIVRPRGLLYNAQGSFVEVPSKTL